MRNQASQSRVFFIDYIENQSLVLDVKNINLFHCVDCPVLQLTSRNPQGLITKNSVKMSKKVSAASHIICHHIRYWNFSIWSLRRSIYYIYRLRIKFCSFEICMKQNNFVKYKNRRIEKLCKLLSAC